MLTLTSLLKNKSSKLNEAEAYWNKLYREKEEKRKGSLVMFIEIGKLKKKKKKKKGEKTKLWYGVELPISQIARHIDS